MTKADHGTRTRYAAGCRCSDCTAANRLHQRDVRARRRGLLGNAAREPGPVELAVREELATLSAAQTRLGAVQAALAMSRILDDELQYPTHVKAAAALENILKLLRQKSGEANRRGRLASVTPLTKGT